jgi:NAD-dependent protein deacetylases, SIR2 family
LGQHRIEDVATPEAWARDPALVQRFYNERRKHILAAEPNAAHKLIAELDDFFDVQVITQNIDDLHERAGSHNVLHLHGIFVTQKALALRRNIRRNCFPLKVQI